MFKKTFLTTLIMAALGSTTIAAAQAKQCMPMAGVAVANFFAEGEGKPIIISGALVGSVQNAAGKILSQTKTATGLTMKLEHYFGRHDGGAFLTKDDAVLTAVPGKKGRYMIEITYHIQKNTTRGTMKGYGGNFISYGLVDIRKTDDMKALVRYEGEICK